VVAVTTAVVVGAVAGGAGGFTGGAVKAAGACNTVGILDVDADADAAAVAAHWFCCRADTLRGACCAAFPDRMQATSSSLSLGKGELTWEFATLVRSLDLLGWLKRFIKSS
jgi:hypothetical protein